MTFVSIFFFTAIFFIFAYGLVLIFLISFEIYTHNYFLLVQEKFSDTIKHHNYCTCCQLNKLNYYSPNYYTPGFYILECHSTKLNTSPCHIQKTINYYIDEMKKCKKDIDHSHRALHKVTFGIYK